MDAKVREQRIHSSDASDGSVVIASSVFLDGHDDLIETLTRIGRSGYAELVLATVHLTNEEAFAVADAVQWFERQNDLARYEHFRESA
jgi:hypothetical protein